MAWWARMVFVAVCVLLVVSLADYGAQRVNERLHRLRGEAVEDVAPKPSPYLSWISTVGRFAPAFMALTAAIGLTVSTARLLAWRGRLMEVVRPRDFVKHVLLFGATGSGKTSTAMRAVELALYRERADVAVIDWKGEYVDYFRGATVVRKLDLLTPVMDAETHAMVVVDILRDVLELTDPMSYMLYDELVRMYEAGEAGFRRLLRRLEVRRAAAVRSRRSAEANVAEGLIRRLLPLALDEGRAAINAHGSDRVVVYDLSGLPTYQLKCLYGQIILWRLYNEARGRPPRTRALRKLIVVEEAQNYVRPRRAERMPGIGERIVNELRAYGYGAILVSPDPSQLPYHMARDAGAVISIGYQGLPGVVADLLNYYRYADVGRLIKETGRPRTYIYYNGRLYIKGAPKPYRNVIDLGVASVEELVGAEEPAKTPLRERPCVEESRKTGAEEARSEKGGRAPEPRGEA